MKKFSVIWSTIFIFAIIPSISGAVVSEQLLNQAGLKSVWQSSLALNAGEKVQKISIIGDYLYILTDTNYLFCIDRNTGRLNFAADIALPNMPVSQPVVYGDTAYIVAENKIIAFDLVQGAEKFNTKISIPVLAAIGANKSYLYVPSLKTRLNIMDTEECHILFEASADDGSNITTVTASDAHVVFATNSGSVVCMNAAEPKKIWQFDAVGSITAPLVTGEDALYLSSRDTNLYKVDSSTGKLIWKFHAGSALTDSARATENTVYQYARTKGLYAVDAKSGKLLWLLPDGVDVLAEDGNISYVFDKNNVCTVMNNKDAKKIYTINFASATATAANVADAKIYIMADKNISCIQPVAK